MNFRFIKVTGSGKIKLPADTTRITATVSGLFREYAESLKHGAEDTEEICRALSACGFERGDIKTLDFSVNTEYEGYEENGVYKNRLSGYRYRHTLKFEFPSDNKRLGAVLYALSNCGAAPEFNISYTVKDREKAKNALLASAVKDAEKKARTLTAASGVALKGVHSINYSFGDTDFEIRPVRVNAVMSKRAAPEAAYDMNVQPDDIEVSDTVTVVWEIE